MAEQTDISLAFELEDITLLECVYHAEAPIQGREIDRRLLVQNPGKRFSLDVKRRRNVLRSVYSRSKSFISVSLQVLW